MSARRLLPWALAVSAACAGDRDTSPMVAVVRDSAGVSIVESTGVDRALAAAPVRATDLVTPDGALSPAPWGVAADPVAGRVYIADQAGRRIAMFDADGTFLTHLGSEGSGPGEFQSPSAVALGTGRVLTVWDARRGVLSRWSSDGELLGEDRPPVVYWGPGFAVGEGRVVTVAVSEEPGAMVQRLVEHGPGGVDTLHIVRQELTVAELPCGTMPAPKLLAPDVVWAGGVDTTYVLRGPAYRIDVLSRGTVVRSIRRDVEPISVTDRMASARAELEPFAGFVRRCGVGPEQLVRAVGHVDVVAPVQAIAVDPAGRLWASRTDDGVTPRGIDVFERDGSYLGTLGTAVIPSAFVSTTRFVGLRVEPTGEVIAALYEVDGVGSGSAAAPREPGSPTLARGDGAASSDERPAPGDGDLLPLGDDELRDCPFCPVMVRMPPGVFLMGSPEGEAPARLDPTRPEWTEDAELPQLRVEIGYAFAIGKYEVTFAQFDRCVDDGGCASRPDDEGWGRSSRPVVNVSRADADEYVRWLSSVTGETYRLPSEAEWEYAARAGTTTARYWGNELGSDRAVCDGCGSRWDARSTAPVGSFPANPFGLHDVYGNAAEWVSDCWTDSHEAAPTDGSPRTTDSPWWHEGACERPVRKGGAWRFYPWTLRAAARSYGRPGPWSDRSPTQGLRVVRSMEPALR